MLFRSAQGKASKDGEDGWFEYHIRTSLPGSPQIMADGSVNYFEMDLIETVVKNQKLVTYHKAINGVYGYTVEGEVISPNKGRERKALDGKGFLLSEDQVHYSASYAGEVTVDIDKRLEVNELLIIQGNVDVSTGNIFFMGNVLIKGDVLTGYQVRATGKIQICGHIEIGRASCRERVFRLV